MAGEWFWSFFIPAQLDCTEASEIVLVQFGLELRENICVYFKASLTSICIMSTNNDYIIARNNPI